MSSPPHPLMHLGMTGWIYLRHTPTAYFRKASVETYPLADWPPRSWRFTLTTDGATPTELAFVDMRRFARVRLIDCPVAEIRAAAPLNANGPDPVVDRALVTEAWLRDALEGRKVPIKALLLDQAVLSGVGNWVGDEVLFHAGVHPEQVAATLDRAQVRALHEQLLYVTSTAVEALANGDPVPDEQRFPAHWLFRHRWGKGKKDAVNRMPDGRRIVFVTVGGRTSAVVEGAQKLRKKMPKEDDGEAVEEEVDANGVDGEVEDERSAAKGKKRKSTAEVNGTSKKQATKKAKAEDESKAGRGKSQMRSPKEVTAKGSGKAAAAHKGKPAPKAAKAEAENASGGRRSGRLSSRNGE